MSVTSAVPGSSAVEYWGLMVFEGSTCFARLQLDDFFFPDANPLRDYEAFFRSLAKRPEFECRYDLEKLRT